MGQVNPWLPAAEVKVAGDYKWSLAKRGPYHVTMRHGQPGLVAEHFGGDIYWTPLVELGGLWQRIPEPQTPEGTE
jgi:hypothetical protein